MAMNPNDNLHPNQTQAGHRLACGRSVEQVWEEMEAGSVSAHAAGCPHCSTARASLDQLVEATRLLIDDPVRPPPGLLDRIMAAARADLTHGVPIPLPSPAGDVDISAHALAAVLRFVIDSVDGLRAHRCRIELAPDAQHTVRVWMSVSLRFGVEQDIALAEARRRAGAALSTRIGLALDILDFEVADVWIDHRTGSRGQP